MTDPGSILARARQLIGAAVFVSRWPSRRMIARQAAEIAELRRYAYLSSGCAEAALEAFERLRNTP
jgi:hypothetical protein